LERSFVFGSLPNRLSSFCSFEPCVCLSSRTAPSSSKVAFCRQKQNRFYLSGDRSFSGTAFRVSPPNFMESLNLSFASKNGDPTRLSFLELRTSKVLINYVIIKFLEFLSHPTRELGALGTKQCSGLSIFRRSGHRGSHYPSPSSWIPLPR